MFKKLLLATTVLFSSQLFSLTLPDQFTVTERWVSWTTTFDIETKEQKFGTVNRKLLSWTPQYHLKDINDELLAKGKMRFWNLLAFFDVTDADGTALGTLEQKFTWFFPTFEIVSPLGLKLARAELNFWGTKYTLFDVVDDHVLATMTRPFFRLKNNWTVNILDPEGLNKRNLHPHMLLVMLAYQVDREYWEAQRRRNQSERDNNYSSASSLPLHSQTVANHGYDPLPPLPERPAEAVKLSALLESYASLTDIQEPTEADFTFIEEAAFDHVKDDDAFLAEAYELIALLDSHEFTDGQKSALYLMLKNRLEK